MLTLFEPQSRFVAKLTPICPENESGTLTMLSDHCDTCQFFIRMHTECCCRCCCCSACLLYCCCSFPAAVRNRVSGGQINSLNLISAFPFSSFKRDLFLMHDPCGGTTAAFTASICLVRASLVIVGIRGAKAGVSPLRRPGP